MLWCWVVTWHWRLRHHCHTGLHHLGLHWLHWWLHRLHARLARRRASHGHAWRHSTRCVILRRLIKCCEVHGLWLWSINRHWSIGATNALRRRNSLSEAVGVQSSAALVRWSVVDIALFSELDHAEDDLAIFWLFKVDVLSDDGIDQIVVCITFFHELWSQYFRKSFSHLKQFFDVKFGSRVYYCRERLVHVLGGSKQTELMSLDQRKVKELTRTSQSA